MDPLDFMQALILQELRESGGLPRAGVTKEGAAKANQDIIDRSCDFVEQFINTVEARHRKEVQERAQAAIQQKMPFRDH